MLKVNNCVGPSAEQFQIVIEGMRLPMNSGYKTDSRIAQVVGKQFMLGNSDEGLAENLIKAGSSDRKFLRQLPIIMEITADQVFWRQCDQYKIGTVTNSSSQMHKLKDTQYTLGDFNIPKEMDELTIWQFQQWLDAVNDQIGLYDCFKDKKYWNSALSMVPQSVYYTKCWSLNYETAVNIGLQREGHKNSAWDILINYWKENLPYYKEFLEASKYKQKELGRLKTENEMLWKTVDGFKFENDGLKIKIQKLEGEKNE